MNIQYIRDIEFIKSDKKYSIHGVDKREAKIDWIYQKLVDKFFKQILVRRNNIS